MEILIFLLICGIFVIFLYPKKSNNLSRTTLTTITETTPAKFTKYPAPQEDRKVELKNKYSGFSTEEVLLCIEIEDNEKVFLLREKFGYTYEEAIELFEETRRIEKKAKLKKIKRKISQKVYELYSDIPTDDERKPIQDDVKMTVWQRDNGKCVKCGGRENLEFDHIIPFSKGGSNTERNIQLLCESCNREKYNNI